MKAIVLAGGGGTRLWPLSREDFPKQFLTFGSKLSLLQRTVQRFTHSPLFDKVIVATNELHRSLVEEQLKDIPCHIFVEPLRKNTAPAIGLTLKILQTEFQVKESELVLVVPSDHLIEPEVLFLNALEQIGENKAFVNQIITFGIRPTKPETGYGYIEIGDKYNASTFRSLRFVEKPDRQTAEKYVENPNFFWNSGMFLFSIQTFWNQLQLHAPEMDKLFSCNLKTAIDRFAEMPDLSIDYAIMEKSKNILVYPLAVSWSDVGSWDSVYEMMEKDQNQNVKIGKVLAIDTTNSLIIGGKRVISTIGINDLLIIETEDAILISKKGESQQIKAILHELKT